MTGVGGDELFEPSGKPARAAAVSGRGATARRPPCHSGCVDLVRRASGVLEAGEALPWLTTEAAAARADGGPGVSAAALVGAERDLRTGGMRDVHSWAGASIEVACGDGVTAEHPFMAPELLSAVAGARWSVGFRSRDDAMDMLFGDVLPQAVRHRSGKAAFFAPFVHRHSRAFIAAWDGRGIDPALVDAAALRACWNQDLVDARSYALLQSAWLFSENGARTRALPACQR